MTVQEIGLAPSTNGSHRVDGYNHLATDTFNVFTSTVTPGDAQAFLENVEHNPRRPSAAVYTRYQRDIENGDWELGGCVLAFDQCGCLVQGQHTCIAIIRANKPIQAVIMVGLTQEAVNVLDSGHGRTAAQILGAHGHKDGNHLAAAVRTGWRWETGCLIGPGTPSRTETVQWLANNPGTTDSLGRVIRMRLSPLKFRASVAAPLHYVATRIAPEVTEPFFEKLETGAGMAVGDPVLVLRNMLLSDAQRPPGKKRIGNGSDSTTRLLAFSVKAWNAYVQGRSISYLKWQRAPSKAAKREDFPEIVGTGGRVWPTRPILARR
jgi:hypothetical protein